MTHAATRTAMESPDRPRVVTDTLAWRASPGGPELEIAMHDALRGFER